ncbi:subtilisin-like protease SBT3.4 [Oryza glaberrima]|uniref:subtilisin-like protease SBT3.4 n=1 Tax=Oryza glaberrima TaxID=4538 RepID=UPI00224C594F|nr:subtilisin-like protease SBT3.4 [Oryza glaberrima]
MEFRSAFCRSALLLVLLVLLPLSASASTKLYIVYMGEKKHDDPSMVTASHHDALTFVIGSKDGAMKSIVYSYKHGFSGFAAMLTESQAEELAKYPGVINVKPNTYGKAHTTRSWDFLGLNYYEKSGLLKDAMYGEDIIIGVVDTGIWPESPSFNDDGYGPVPARWKGVCQTGDAFNITNCNRKIIGARWYSAGATDDMLKGEYMSPRDFHGHGTHTASTIAGGQVWNVSHHQGGLGAGVARGGAPRARVAVYKVCWGVGGNFGDAAVLAAVDDAINDGVDVLSLSLGGPNEIHGTLHAVARGITVVFAGGNDGPTSQSVQNTVPWVITVAAATIDRTFPTTISLGNNEKLLGQSLYYNATVSSIKFHSLVVVDGQSSAINFTGNVVLWPEPYNIRNDTINLLAKEGVKGIIFAQGNTVNVLEILDACNGIMPCAVVDKEIANRIASYATSTSMPVVKVSPAVTVVGNGVLSPRVAGFSSRGPGTKFPGILKPDIAAPGASILAAVGDSYKFMSGTSMACPHVSAVVALLKSVHPDWSPAMIKSAIVTTASVTDRFGMPIQAEGSARKVADPFDFGGGHIEPNKAIDPGLVYDIDPKDYTKFFNCSLDPQEGCKSYMGKLYQLNLPSIAVPDLKDSVIVWRTVTNVGGSEANYKVVVEAPAGVNVVVEPQVITFAKGGSQSATFKVTFTARQRVQGGYTFGSLTWLDDNTHSVRIPVAVRTIIQDFVSDTA